MLPRLPSKPARQNSFGSQSKARRHEESRSRRSESDLVAEIGRFREEQRGNMFIAVYKHNGSAQTSIDIEASDICHQVLDQSETNLGKQ